MTKFERLQPFSRLVIGDQLDIGAWDLGFGKSTHTRIRISFSHCLSPQIAAIYPVLISIPSLDFSSMQ
jgi:hypothetical protein